MSILWGVEPPPDDLDPAIGVLVVKPGWNVVARVLGPLTGVMTHWVKGRTKICLGAESCPFHECPMIWRGYMPVQCQDYDWRGPQKGKHLAALMVTPSVSKVARSLRVGEVFRVSRETSNVRARLIIVPTEQAAGSKVPEVFDVKPYVLKATGFFSPRPGVSPIYGEPDDSEIRD